MSQQKIDKVVITIDGKEHTFEGGHVKVVKTYRAEKGERVPTGWVEVVVPVTTEWATGEDGRYLSTPTVKF